MIKPTSLETALASTITPENAEFVLVQHRELLLRRFDIIKQYTIEGMESPDFHPLAKEVLEAVDRLLTRALSSCRHC